MIKWQMQFAVSRPGTKVDRQSVFNNAPGAAFVFAEERPMDQFDIDAAVLYRLDRIGDLDQLGSGFLRINAATVYRSQ
jgi:hypothetical protein